MLNKLVRLVHQRGYKKEKIVSDVLKRYLPASQYIGASAEVELRKSFAKTEPDGKTSAYLAHNVEIEIQLCRERVVG